MSGTFVDDLFLSVAASTSTAQIRKERQPSGTFTGLEGGRPINTATVALKHLEDKYDGKRKPALVLQFRSLPDGAYTMRFGDGVIEVRPVDGKWQARVKVKNKYPQWSRYFKRFLNFRTVLKGDKRNSPGQAVRALMIKPGWFFDGIEWRSAAWVYKSLLFFGLGCDQKVMPSNYVTSIRSGKHLHVTGTWIWHKDSLPQVRVPVNTPFPSLEGKSRTPVPYDIRTSEAYVQDVHVNGKMKVSYRAVNDRGVVVKLEKKLVKAPVELPYTNKNPNPNKQAGLRPNQHSATESIEQYTPLTEWVKGEQNA